MLLGLLIALDVAFRLLWHPHPPRLPEQFTGAYLGEIVDSARGTAPVLVLGDSVLWGYDLPAPDSAAVQLAADRPRQRFLNLSYEGGSIVNSYWGLRLALARGVHPAAVVLNLNSKELNPADSAYARLHPSLEAAVLPLLTPRDRALLDVQPPPDVAGRLDAAVARVWDVYRHRVDIRVAFFGVDDAAGFVLDGLQQISGERRRAALAHRPTAAAFEGTYDLETPAPDNVEMIYLRELRNVLVREHIPTLAFLTPTNHRLLAADLDDGIYAHTLAALTATLRGPGIRIVDLDRLPVGGHFLDNDHLDAAGSRMLAARLAADLPPVR